MTGIFPLRCDAIVKAWLFFSSSSRYVFERDLILFIIFCISVCLSSINPRLFININIGKKEYPKAHLDCNPPGTLIKRFPLVSASTLNLPPDDMQTILQFFCNASSYDDKDSSVLPE